MGCGSFTSSDWSSYTTSRGIKEDSKVSDMYKSTTVKSEMEPVGVKFRESCDSEEHPYSTPIILGLDVTGSMGYVLEIISKKLGTLIEEIYNRKPVEDPQIMFMAFGDVEWDRHPLQVTQFESDIRIAEQLNDVYFERGGGPNDGESYTLPWYFAARHTKIDSYEKRGKKGFLFTIGDEKYLDSISIDKIKEFVGDDVQSDLSAEELLAEVSRSYEVYHLMIEEGNGMASFYFANRAIARKEQTIEKWTNLLGQRAILVSDCSKIPEIIVSILEVASGKDVKEVISSWEGTTSDIVGTAISGLTTVNGSTELIEF